MKFFNLQETGHRQREENRKCRNITNPFIYLTIHSRLILRPSRLPAFLSTVTQPEFLVKEGAEKSKEEPKKSKEEPKKSKEGPKKFYPQGSLNIFCLLCENVFGLLSMHNTV
jgi:hypothetical protein